MSAFDRTHPIPDRVEWEAVSLAGVATALFYACAGPSQNSTNGFVAS